MLWFVVEVCKWFQMNPTLDYLLTVAMSVYYQCFGLDSIYYMELFTEKLMILTVDLVSLFCLLLQQSWQN